MALIENELLITTKDELSLLLGATGWIDLDPLFSDLLDAQRDELAPLLGKEMLERLIEQYYYTILYDAMTPEEQEEEDPEIVEDLLLTDTDKKLLFLCQKLIVNYGLSVFQSLGSLDFSGSGLRIAESDQFKSVKQWQADDLREYFFTKAYKAMDEILKFLEENVEDYLEWAENEDAFSINKKFIVSSAKTFEEYHVIGGRRTFIGLYPAMKATEAFVIETALGTELYNRIKAELKAGEVTEDIQAILPWIQGATAKYTIARAVQSSLIEVRGNGIYLKEYAANGADRNNRLRKTPDPYFLQTLENNGLSEGEQWMKKAIDYLQANADADTYPEWFESSLYVDPEESKTTKFYNDDPCSKTFML